MIKSMTGYGSASGTSGALEITIELRSVNNRFLDCSVRMPKVYVSLEDGLKAQIQKAISRGKVDVFVTIDSSKADDVVISLNTGVADAYAAAIEEISKRYGVKNDSTAMSLARLPDVLSVERAEADKDKLAEDMSAILAAALEDFDSMRRREGQKMFDDLNSRADRIEELTAFVEERSPRTVQEYRERLEQRMRDVLASANIDETRILTEAAIYADKVAVAEETVRLRSHIAQFRQLIAADEPVGRKLDFLVQEFNREANTIGSKGGDVQITQTVVELKSEIEKIREQIQNVE